MNKIIAMAIAAVSLVACNDRGTDTTSTENATVDMRDTTTTYNSTNGANAYAPVEGDVTRRNGKVMVMRNGEWVEADKDVRMDNGVVIYRDGRVVRNGQEVRLEDEEVVDRTGNFFDRTGRALEKGWDKTKEGAKEVGRDVRDATRKAGDKIENAVDNDRKN